MATLPIGLKKLNLALVEDLELAQLRLENRKLKATVADLQQYIWTLETLMDGETNEF